MSRRLRLLGVAGAITSMMAPMASVDTLWRYRLYETQCNRRPPVNRASSVRQFGTTMTVGPADWF